MKVYSRLALALTAGFFLCSADLVSASSMTFSDNTINFPGYSSDSRDEIGSPGILSMTVNWNDATGFLENVSIALRTGTVAQNFDNLFINNDYGDCDNNLQGWDYLVHSGGDINSQYTRGDVFTNNGLYYVDETYSYTTVSYNDGRYGHANGIDRDDIGRRLNSLTRTYNSTSNTLTWNFIGTSINLGTNFSIGYTPWCANDVILVSNAQNKPVPEPATMLLFGAGLLSIASWRARRNK